MTRQLYEFTWTIFSDPLFWSGRSKQASDFQVDWTEPTSWYLLYVLVLLVSQQSKWCAHGHIFLAEIPVLAIVRWLYFSIFPKALANVFFFPKELLPNSTVHFTYIFHITYIIYINFKHHHMHHLHLLLLSYILDIIYIIYIYICITYIYIYIYNIYINFIYINFISIIYIIYIYNLYHLQRSCYMGIVIQYRSCDTEVVIQELLHRSELPGDPNVSELLQNSYFSRVSKCLFWRQGQPYDGLRNVTLCGDRACRTHKRGETRICLARGLCRRNPLRRAYVSDA